MKTKHYKTKKIARFIMGKNYYNKVKLYKIILDYLLNKDYENIYKLYSSILPEKATIIDVGANMGQYACRLNKIVKNGIIYSLEPETINFRSLYKMKSILRLDQVKISNIALSDVNGSGNLIIPVMNGDLVIGTQAFLKDIEQINPEVSNYRTEIVSTNTLSSFIKKENITKIDLLKLDTEGAELKILSSSIEIIEKYSPIISMEFSCSLDSLSFLSSKYFYYFYKNGRFVDADKIIHQRSKGNLLLIPKSFAASNRNLFPSH